MEISYLHFINVKDNICTYDDEELSEDQSNPSIISRVKRTRQAAISKAITEELTNDEIEEEKRYAMFI